jgi:hypothetical protein
MRKVVFVAAVLALLPTALAWAYIPPSAFILKSVVSKHAGLKGLRVRSTVTAMEGEKLGATHFKEVTYFNPQTETLHIYAFDDRIQKLYAVERRPEAATAADGLLFWHDYRSLENALKARGLPVRSEDELLKMKDEDERRASEVERLTRWNTSLAWVIGGAKDGDPQLWIEKDSFLPLRLIASPQPDAEPVDLTFEGNRYYHEFPFPRAIVAVKRKEPLFRDEVQDVSLAPETAEFRSTVVPGFTELGNAAPGPLHDLIQKYFEVLR